jgi:HlyD family secretion protein
MRRRTIIIILVCAILLAGGYWTYRYFSKVGTKEPSWKTTKVEKGTVAIAVTATGSVSADTTVLVGAQVSGIVSKILVDFDSVVRKGQVIALLDTTLLYAAYLDAEASLSKARALEELQRRNFARADTLFVQKVAAQSDYDLAYTNYKSAQSDLQSATANLNHARINLRYATITAPISGTVISRNVDVGQTVISSFNAPTLFTIANKLTKMQVLANVDESDIGLVKQGQVVDFTVDAFPNDKFRGIVGLIRLQPVTIQNVVNYIVVIDVANPELKLLPGLTANIAINVDQHENVLRVPSNVVHFMPDKTYMTNMGLADTFSKKLIAERLAANEIPQAGTYCYIWVKRQDKLYPERVKAGLFDGNYIEIEGNVRAGDEVVAGINTEAASSPTAKNPFMPQMRPSKR